MWTIYSTAKTTYRKQRTSWATWTERWKSSDSRSKVGHTQDNQTVPMTQYEMNTAWSQQLAASTALRMTPGNTNQQKYTMEENKEAWS